MMRRGAVVVVGVAISAGALSSPALAKLPSTSRVETFVVERAPSRILAAYSDCSRTGPRSWSCEVTTAKDVGDGGGPSYHVTARYLRGRLYAGRYVKN
jgi:hypothetical protein